MANEEDVGAVIDEGRGAMQKALERFGKELTKIRTGRASTSILDGINVDYFDTPTPLNQLAALSVPDPRMIVVSPFDKSAIASIEKTIHASDLGLTPTNDGKVIRLQIPPLTEERRKVLVKQVRKIAEDHRVRVRDARRDSLSLLKDLEEDGLSKDDRHRAEKKVQDVTDEFVKKIDEQTAQKEKDVLEV
jgi:ribosome recycling factor